MYTDMMPRLTDNWMGAAESDYMMIAIVFGVESFDRSKFNWYFPKVCLTLLCLSVCIHV